MIFRTQSTQAKDLTRKLKREGEESKKSSNASDSFPDFLLLSMFIHKTYVIR